MYVPRPPFPILAALCGSALLGGCVGNPFGATPIDPSSPVAADVAQLSRQEGKFPTFASIPKTPTDMRPAAQYGMSADRVAAAGDALIRATEPGTWTLQATDAFAEAARRDAGPAIDPARPGDAEAYARELRERATPPPPR